jgi:uncharacterized protein
VKFVCDVMLGKLAKYLRLLGIDATYVNDPSQLKGMDQSEEPWIFVTRRAKPTGYLRSYVVRSELARQQVNELKPILKPFIDPSKMLNRCIECNTPLEVIERTEVEHRVPEFVFHHYRRFRVCPSCNRIYWEGSHAGHMNDLLKELMD